MNKYPEYKNLNLPEIGKEILRFWEEEKTFEKSVSTRGGKESFVFYEGPPSANGMPGIHHVMARAIKDIFCRYQTLKGKKVSRKAGWDTHGLPIELAVEKTLGITKEDIGKKISVEDYNKACRTEVMKYTDKWEEVTKLMGYWVDMTDPYVTYKNEYIESVWYLLKKLYSKNLLYKGYTIQPYSPAAGTGLSTHELNQPGCYRNVKDTSVVAQFKVQGSRFKEYGDKVYFLAWTTTPWTLPANCALAVGEKIDYVLVAYINRFSKKICIGIVAEALYGSLFSNSFTPKDAKNFELATNLQNKHANNGIALLEALVENNLEGAENKPWGILLQKVKGAELLGIKYEQLLPYVQPDGKAFEVIAGDFVTTDDGTGIVHTASVFGADDFRVCRANGIASVLVKDENGNDSPLVDKRGRFVMEVNDADWGLGGEYVKVDYLTETEKDAELKKQQENLKKFIPNLKEYLSVDERLALKLKLEGKAFKIEKYEHNYPHCWRTDKPILYYPMDSWFVKVTEPKIKERMIALNKTINWKPESTGTGRFGEWLNNLNDWNLSRSRFWGIPLPIWRSEDRKEEKIIGSIEELRAEVESSVKAGFMSSQESLVTGQEYDLHKPYIDRITLVSDSGKKMVRESDLIDVWFDSGAMPFAQWGAKSDDDKNFRANFPADFIAEGVDQTRGWFYTLHAIAVTCFDSVAYKNVVSNGLVLDKNGNKMSKRLGNAVDPFSTIDKYGADAVRWYMVCNASPWDNLKFDLEGVAEKQRSFFGTLYNTYAFYALYANIDSFRYDAGKAIPVEKRSELDRWIISKLNSLLKIVSVNLDKYDPTPAGREIENFVNEHLSNWYVRLSRRRFWKPSFADAVAGKGALSDDKQAAYDTLFECLSLVSQLASPIAPFFSDWLFRNLMGEGSVHLSYLPKHDPGRIDAELEARMDLAQKISSMVFSIRKKENIRVRQPLTKIRIPVLDAAFQKRVDAVKELILSEVNVKELESLGEKDTQIVKNLKLNFKTLGKKCGKDMKAVQAFGTQNAQAIIKGMEQYGKFELKAGEGSYILEPEDVEIIPVDIPGWKVANSGSLTVALDVTITGELKEEGLAREIVNRIQNLRKDKGFEVTDRISLKIKSETAYLDNAIKNNLNYICAETLTANSQEVLVQTAPANAESVELDEDVRALISIEKFN